MGLTKEVRANKSGRRDRPETEDDICNVVGPRAGQDHFDFSFVTITVCVCVCVHTYMCQAHRPWGHMQRSEDNLWK